MVGKDPQTMDPVINVASPLGLGKQVFTGSVTSAMVDREIVQDDINWTKAVLVQIPGTDGGSSGSSIVCLTQRAICAFLVGTSSQTTMVAMPVSRMISFREALKAGKYQYWKDDSGVGIPQSRAKSKHKNENLVGVTVIPLPMQHNWGDYAFWTIYFGAIAAFWVWFFIQRRYNNAKIS
jgi:hypothetical protein